MKMPPQKPGNGYYEYEDVSNSPNNTIEHPPDEQPNNVLLEQNSNGPPLEQNSNNPSLEQNSNNPAMAPNSNNPEDDFSEYLWMENEEEFDKQVMQQLEEEELTEQCLEAMLEHGGTTNSEGRTARTNSQCSQVSEGSEILNLVNNFKLDLVDVTKSTLNPLAAEFIPYTPVERTETRKE